MVKRKRVAVIFSYNENWIAGSYYIQNLIFALNQLPDEEKPELVVLSDEKDFEKIKTTQYPYLEYQPILPNYSLPEKVFNKISRTLFQKNIFEKRMNGTEANIFFPASHDDIFGLIPTSQKLFWIPDFQEHHFPDFFSEQVLAQRKRDIHKIIQANSPIVFSSEDSEKDFHHFYPSGSNKTYVLPFAVTHPSYDSLEIKSLLEKYQISQPYYFSPNQFWKHKNHIVVLEALKILKEQQVSCQVVFTGKEYDYRNPDYFDELKKYVADNKLTDCVKFLGFIDRKEQLKLMSESLAVIQPSLFEGWSTVVEDAKAMNKFVILSDLNVHREQLKQNVTFFNPRKPEELAACMSDANRLTVFADYKQDIINFGRRFMNVVNEIIS
jgi:glycosyltransferase involved in cell wall biosynthesis